MKLRELPGALILGLLASLLAHTASYGDGHIAGGQYHDALASLALAGGVGFAASLALFGWLNARRMAEGSIVAARLRRHLPSPAAVCAIATVCFAGIEALETAPHAQTPSGLIVLALVVASWAICALARFMVGTLAGIAVQLVARGSALRRPAFVRRAAARVRVMGTLYAFRRFARPPPRVQPA